MEALGYVIGIALCIGIYRFFAWWQNRPEYIEREKEKQLKQAIAAQQLAKLRQDDTTQASKCLADVSEGDIPLSSQSCQAESGSTGQER